VTTAGFAADALRGRRALVTGAGSGIGRATVLTLAALGAEVAAVDVDAKRAVAVASEANNAGGRATPFVFDLAHTAELAALPVRAAEVKPLLVPGAPGRRCWSRWSARSEARTNELDQPEGRCMLAMGRGLMVRGRPALPGCSTNWSSATTSLIGCLPRGVRGRVNV
jgi:hypothetical protein